MKYPVAQKILDQFIPYMYIHCPGSGWSKQGLTRLLLPPHPTKGKDQSMDVSSWSHRAYLGKFQELIQGCQ